MKCHGKCNNSQPIYHPGALNLSTSLAPTDSSHERAGGNLRYYEKLLHKQLSEMNQESEPASEEPIQLGTYSRPKDHLPEREAYEALCRGEGLKMVKIKTNKKNNNQNIIKLNADGFYNESDCE